VGAAEKIIASPGLSLLWNGNFPVCIFFVLSGYVLTKKFFETGRLADLTDKAMRRYIRLAVPILGSVMLSFAMMSLDTTAWRVVAGMTGSSWLAQFWNFTPTFGDALKDGLYRAILSGASQYVSPLWTMQVELIGSFLVFGYAAIAPRDRRAIPLAVVIAAIMAFLSPQSWPLYAAFLAGAHVGQMSAKQPRVLVVAAAALAILFGSYDMSPIYDWTTWISPNFYMRKHLFNVLGGIAVVYAVRAGFGAKLLESRPVQYLGRISYALYLVHFPLVLTLFSSLFLHFTGTGLSRAPAAGIAIAVTFAASCALATIFQKTFDTWGITLSRRFVPRHRAANAASMQASTPMPLEDIGR
jgi:peptidoglycan/LPS O-acetylase OafA/YrhL